MSRYCHVPGCRNGLGKCLTTAPSEPVSYHTLPKGEPQRTRWLNAVRLRASHKDTSSLRVCSDHFLPEDFYYDPKISSELKFKLKKRNLNRDAVPSIFPAAIVRPPQRPRDRVASIKPAFSQASRGISVHASTSTGCGQESRQSGDSGNATQARRQEQRCGRASQPEQDAVPMPGKTAAVSSRSIAVQAFPDLRSIGTQANLPKHVKSKSVKVCMGNLHL